ncbi:hypothetical protein BJF79_41005 [Actinomadura sp. CNU-125]|nr:hypothetical protein BJF79_41005 [Actinomadura sp. CNU-125]
MPRTGSLTGCGVPEYATTAVNSASLRSGSAGVISSSPCPRCVRAGAPFTVTFETFRSVRSRLNRASRSVAFALIVAVPDSCSAPSGVIVSFSP